MFDILNGNMYVKSPSHTRSNLLVVVIELRSCKSSRIFLLDMGNHQWRINGEVLRTESRDFNPGIPVTDSEYEKKLNMEKYTESVFRSD